MSTFASRLRSLSLFILSVLAVIALLGMAGSTGTAAQNTASQIIDELASDSSAELGVPLILVANETFVHTPDNMLQGPAGVHAYAAELEAAYSGAAYAVTDIRSVGDLVIVDWQATSGTAIVLSGRSILVFEDGVMTELWLLDRYTVSPPQPAAFGAADADDRVVTGPAPASFATDADQDANESRPQPAFASPVTAATFEARQWPDYDTSSFADPARTADAVREAQQWPDYDPSSLGRR